MLGYRKKSFAIAHALLKKIQNGIDDVENTLKCQMLLLDEILIAEKQIQRHKTNLNNAKLKLKNTRPNRSVALKLKNKIKWTEQRIDSYQGLLYVWRNFGDGIVFSFLDRFAVKHVFYETENSKAKQDAGFVGGKSGLQSEIILVEDATRHGIPAVLTDLTNSIRHGDVCLLGASDPRLVEVKSTSRLNKRGKRQVESIEKLHSFFDTDQAMGLRGIPKLNRVEHPIAPHYYEAEMNQCIKDAVHEGYSITNPEPGLHYAAIYSGEKNVVEHIFGQIDAQKPTVFSLNEFKSSRAWAPYYPFTLSIHEHQHLYDFIKGNLFLIVCLDREVVCQAISDMGLDPTFDDDPYYPLRYVEPSSGFEGHISRHILQRVALEFLSPKWLLEYQHHALKRRPLNPDDGWIDKLQE
ncbi:MAG: hypothetical protein JJ878_03980 [Alphaproteobacteria bacterium]|nr:hypothetical protein [Alphaproteobacteria bacterium]MBO6861771.1 hypothetical protein [Alphaproteobacteria bacterium]